MTIYNEVMAQGSYRLRVTPYHYGLLIAVPVLVWLLISVLGNTGFGRVLILEQDIAKEQIEVATLLERNQLMAEKIDSLKTDNQEIEFLARYHFGMIKSDEVFIQLPKATKAK